MINWFEIPVQDIKRAMKFYGTILDIEIREIEMMGSQMGFFPSEGKKVSGALVQGPDYKPLTDGVLLYLNGGDDLQKVLSKVEKNGGKVILPKTQISPDIGYFALFTDTEGNKLALHSMH